MKYYNQFLDGLSKIISFNTVRTKGSFPFGDEIEKCLIETLSQLNSLGFNTINKHYYGIADLNINQSSETLGILGHIDIVPFIESEWDTPPLELTLKDNKLIARGVMDDKGPLLACAYAIAELKNTPSLKQTKNIRIIIGCDEESHCECIKKYNEIEEIPTYSFTPDADFPCVNFEKQILTLKVEIKKPDLIEYAFGGTAKNIVMTKLTYKLKNQEEKTISGKAAHGSLPEDGENAFINFLKKYMQDDKDLRNLYDKLQDVYGKGLNIDIKDNTGSLSFCISMLETKNDTFIFTFDIRLPLIGDKDVVIKKIKESLNAKILIENYSPYLYIEENSFLVKTLTDTYNSIMQKNLKPLAIGGGTYAKYLSNCIGFGPTFKHSIKNIHQANESVFTADFENMYLIYLEAIKKLAFENS